ncbi:nitric oxide synthase oxygenase [Streptomyces avermitilis]|uniref:nitric oxide synthase oxygenase n=1 Tax=Streptomyces avermitilis TaxID=33903 RepID=UPI00367D1837
MADPSGVGRGRGVWTADGSGTGSITGLQGRLLADAPPEGAASRPGGDARDRDVAPSRARGWSTETWGAPHGRKDTAGESERRPPEPTLPGARGRSAAPTRGDRPDGHPDHPTGSPTTDRPARPDRREEGDGQDGHGGQDGHDGHDLLRAATAFLTLHHTEERLGDPARRIAAAHAEIAETGTYRHTTEELVFGARVAWRNANRCIGRLYWHSLCVRDRRDVRDAKDVAEASADHLREATRDGRIRALITVFAPEAPGRPGPRIWNEQLIRYAGYARPGGGVTGDPRNAGLTALARRLGWPGGPGSPFDVLPLIVQSAGDRPRWFTLPEDAVLEVALTHPEYPWWRSLGLRWHAVPALAGMCLEIGGICYPAAPFNGWYMGTEIGARNLADTDRYDLLPHLADRLGLDTRSDRSLWKDRALVELNRSVLHSFDRAGVTVTDHHTESLRFLTHLDREERKGRRVGADWSWIVPPISGSATPVFHRTYETVERHPAYVHHPEALARARGEIDEMLV